MQFKGTGQLYVKDLDVRQGIVSSYWNAFGNKDEGGDIAVKGCWARSIKERGPQSAQPRVKFLYQHDEKMLVARPSELCEDAFGLLATYQIPPTTLGKDILTLYEYGIITEHSVGYETVQSQWDSKSSARLLQECVLWEGSAVTWGMNSATPVVAVKALTQPDTLTTIATKAAKIDRLLHDGNLRSDALCQSLERELKALHTALAPSQDAPDERQTPYSIQSVLDGMADLKSRLAPHSASGEQKAATQADKDAQAARAKKYGIGAKDGGNVTKPSKYAKLTDDDFADPVNYSYPLDTKAHADNAAARFGDPDNRAVYTKDEQAIIDKRIAAAQKSFGEDDKTTTDSNGKAAASVSKRLIKGSGGDIEVSPTGTHGAYTGTHSHAHKAMGSQGDDVTHDHEHTHDGNGDHGHDHGAAPKAAAHAGKRPIRKARDFGTLFASLNESDQLQDDWGDTFIALVQAMEELMWQSQAQNNGWTPEGAETVDIAEAAKANLDAFSTAVMDLVTRSVAADFVPCMTPDRDQFIDPDGPNADDGMDQPYKGRAPVEMPSMDTLLRLKVGRAVSAATRETLTKAADGIVEHVKGIMEHHAAITDLLKKTDPDAVRQDEDDALGDDDTENGGHNINDKSSSSTTSTPRRRTAAGSPPHAGTTSTGHPFDLSAFDADYAALKSRVLARQTRAGAYGRQ